MAECVSEVTVEGRLTGEDSLVSTTAVRRDSVLQPLRKPLDEYLYAPLDNLTENIRLCSITPSPEGSEVAVSLRSVTLADTINPYICLSYVWGNMKSIRATISLNGCRHEIGPNLHSLLVRLRALGITENLWIDALCIDQKDEAEKTEQVKLMGKIYSGAQEVVIGLEEVDQDARQQQPCRTNVETTIVGLAQNSCLHELDAFTARPATKLDTGTGHAFRQLLKSSWFSRTWVVQEICLSKEASLLCSWGKVSWQMFVQAFRNWNYHRKNCCRSFAENLDDELKAACYRVYCAVEAIVYTTNNLQKEQHLLELLLMYQHLDVSDERDKVFAFQGLHTAKGELPPPDYTKGKRDVYTKLAVWMVEDACSLMILALDLHEDRHLPSWVPDFAAKPPIDSNYWRSRLTFYGTYDCSKGLDWSFEYQAPSTLRLSGIMVDHIQYVARPTLAFQAPVEHAQLLKEYYAFAGGGITSLPCPEALNETFVETMIAGCTQDKTGIHRADAKDLAHWREIMFHLIQGASLEHHHASSPLMACHMTAILNRTLFRTASGLLGLGPKSLKSSDEVWLLAGSKAPVILSRQHKQPGLGQPGEAKHILLGHAYIHSIMDGSAIDPRLQIEPCMLV